MAPGSVALAAATPGPVSIGTSGLPLPDWKRTLDLTLCLAALPMLGLCTAAMAVLTRLVSPGPVFFRQERIGHLGRPFRIYKFRTMHFGADCAVHQNYCKTLIRSDAPMAKLDDQGDKRLFRFARMLRASGLDELPQIINVLRGEMSVVGPRPCLPAEFDSYRSWQRGRCDVLPGLTGLWQVSGKNRTTFDQMIRLDLRYARECGLTLDLKIILRTIPALVAQVLEGRRTRKMRPPGAAKGASPSPRLDSSMSWEDRLVTALHARWGHVGKPSTAAAAECTTVPR